MLPYLGWLCRSSDDSADMWICSAPSQCKLCKGAIQSFGNGFQSIHSIQLLASVEQLGFPHPLFMCRIMMCLSSYFKTNSSLLNSEMSCTCTTTPELQQMRMASGYRKNGLVNFRYIPETSPWTVCFLQELLHRYICL